MQLPSSWLKLGWRKRQWLSLISYLSVRTIPCIAGHNAAHKRLPIEFLAVCQLRFQRSPQYCVPACDWRRDRFIGPVRNFCCGESVRICTAVAFLAPTVPHCRVFMIHLTNSVRPSTRTKGVSPLSRQAVLQYAPPPAYNMRGLSLWASPKRFV
jgi:hypothetical protein